MRALVGAGWSRYGSASDDATFIAPAFDHDSVLPRCRAAVHHGGAGTTAAALRAGLAAVVCPVISDQPLWGARLTERARAFSETLRREDGMHATVDAILA